MKKKICHITSVHRRYDTRIYSKQAISLVRNGFDVTILVNDTLENESRDGVEIVSLNNIKLGRLNRIRLTKKIFLKKALEINADVYQIHDPELIPLGLSLLKENKTVIFDSHEDFPCQILEKNWIPFPLRKLISIIANSYYRINLKKFSAVLSVTPHIVDKINHMGANTFMVTNYPELDIEKNFNDRNQYMNREDNLFYLGTVYNSSQQENILESLNRVSDIKYTIVGSIDEEYKSQLSKYPAWDKVRFIDFVPRNEVRAISDIATVALCVFDYSPNLGYNVGTLGSNKLFEYMQSGLPIICTDFKLWKENIIDKYNCGICVNPHDINEISNAIRYLKNNKEDAFKMGQNARRAFVEEFNWETQASEYIRIINKIL